MEDWNTLKKKTALMSVYSNTSLVLVKLAAGYISGSVSILSEAAHSAIDLLAAFIAYFAVKKAGRPPDEDHAYGHGKFENLSAAAEALLIVLVAVWIIFEAWQKLKAPHLPEKLYVGVAVMALSVLVNTIVSRRLFRVAARTGSQALEADALHLRTDVWTSGGVLAGLLMMYVTGYAWLDAVVAAGVAVFIFKAGYDMTKANLHELTDIALPESEAAMIREILENHPEVCEYHKLRTRRSGPQRYIDVHVALDQDLLLKEAFVLSRRMEDEIKARLPLSDVTIRLEPCDP